MNARDGSLVQIVRLLEVDPDLGETLSDDARRTATHLIQARVAPIEPGVWTPPLVGPADVGLLVLDGLMVRKVRVGTSSSTEVIGPTDLLRPGDQESLPRLLPDSTEWRVLQECRLAVLDARVTAAIGRWPALTAAVCARFLRRSRSLAYLMAAQHFTRVTDRLLATLWHMASRWGRVTPQGTVVPFRLTHEMLGEIIGARRPTTTQAVSALERRGLLLRDEKRHLVLLGAPESSLLGPAVGEAVLAASA